ncbi:MAG: cytochrome-c peroxidase [Saprospiraceae bacterium]|nr:cytochrome-c peroxidase [Saprospiraceae bacterium]
MRAVLIAGLFTFLMVSCRKEQSIPADTTPEPLLFVPQGFPMPEFPADNQLTPARFALGKKLFFDPIMSLDSTVSCASCHDPAHAFSDSVALSQGVAGAPGVRNAPTLSNVVYQPYYTREGGLPTLEMQVLVPIQEHNEFDFNMLRIVDRLKNDTTYVRMSREAYDRAPDAFVVTRAIACFERTLVSGNSRYDQYQYQGKSNALTAAELRGMALFFSERTSCSACHTGFNFSNYAFENNGLYETYPDPGRYRLTLDTADLARFKVPTLRNVGLTAPYMHDGSISSLGKVVAHYNAGGQQHPHKSTFVRPLHLTALEQSDLVHFLESLTDESFARNPKFRP